MEKIYSPHIPVLARCPLNGLPRRESPVPGVEVGDLALGAGAALEAVGGVYVLKENSNLD